VRLVTIEGREVGGRPGVWLPTGDILDLQASAGTLGSTQWLPQSVVSVLAQGEDGMARVRELAAQAADLDEQQRAHWRQSGRLLPFTGTRLLAPIRRPGLLLVVELSGTLAEPGELDAYLKNPHAATGSDTAVRIPGGPTERLELQSCFGLVLGQALYQCSAVAAVQGIAAFTTLADLGSVSPVSGRKPPRRQPVAQAALLRQFPGSCPLGPAVITPDEFSPALPLLVTTRINGHSVTQLGWDARRESYGPLVAAVARHFALAPGDVIAIRGPGGPVTAGDGDRVSLALGTAMSLNFSVGRPH
jgi:2-keto-4-pentenoate hydratase/2-oxohepta-3-ene-1,7-dioic acid hydratase in catechol pathway